MRAALLVTSLVVGSVLVPAASAAPACRHLLTDPRGDASYANSGDALRAVEDGRSIDLLTVDLSSDRKALLVDVRVAGRPLETGSDVVDHMWSVSFSTETDRFQVRAKSSSALAGPVFTLYEEYGEPPDDYQEPSVSVGRAIDYPVTGSVDEAKGVVRVVVPLGAFESYAGLGRSIGKVRVITWTGQLSANWISGDFGTSTSSYRVGARACS